MRSDLLLACISGPLLAVFLLKGKARRLLAAVFGGMLIAFSQAPSAAFWRSWCAMTPWRLCSTSARPWRKG